jgi:chorismate-pyruvate lyase
MITDIAAIAPSLAVASGPVGVEGFSARLVERHFCGQRDRPERLADVGLGDLAPDLRMLLFTDGTVTRALEARTLRQVSVSVHDERYEPVRPGVAACLDVAPGAGARRRRVMIYAGDGERPALFAESVIVLERLPKWFSPVLQSTSQGLGQALAAGKLESRRELLWYGLATAPRWAGPLADGVRTLVRAYRVVIEARPAMLIEEALAVQPAGDTLEAAP